MGIGWKSARVFIPLVLLCTFFTVGQTNAAFAAQGNSNGAAGQMPAFYDGEQVTVNMKQMPDPA